MSARVDFDGLVLETRGDAYEPREDSFLLARAARAHAFGRVLDLGCGSGIVGISAAQNPRVERVTAVDVNPTALALARENAALNGVAPRFEFVESDLFSALSGSSFDTVCFNPPYLPEEPDARLEERARLALEGGKTGRAVLDRFLDDVSSHLATNGIVLVLSSSVASSAGDGSGNAETLEKLAALGFAAGVVANERFFFEELAVVRAQRA